MRDLPTDTLPQRVAYLVALSGLDQSTLSLRAGLARGHIGMMIRGAVADPAGSSLARLAETTGTTTDWLISGKGAAPREAKVRAAVERALASGHTASDFRAPSGR
jgi:transcriptional regulator with XRE-family HTH domain